MANLSSTRIFGDGTVERSLYVKQQLGVGVGSPDEKIHVQSAQEAILKLEADTDNTDETDHARVEFIQDDGAVNGFVGYANGNNALRLENTYSSDIRLATNGNERVRIESGGNVGIGTTSPQTKLDVRGDVSFGSTGEQKLRQVSGVNAGQDLHIINEQGSNWQRLRLVDSGGNNGVFTFDFTTNGGSSWNESARIQENGNVGIGTSPSYKLDVDGDINATGVGRFDITGSADRVDGYEADDFFIQKEDNFVTYNDRTGTGGNWRFGVISDGRIQLDHTNQFGQDFLIADRDNDSLSTDVNFGIGTTSPSYKLEVQGDIKVNEWLRDNNNNRAYRAFSGGDRWMALDRSSGDRAGVYDYRTSENRFWVESGGPAAFLNGNVGIGTTTPEHLLQVGGNEDGVSLGLQGQNGDNVSSEIIFADGAFSSSMGIRYDSDNNRIYIDDNYDGGGGSTYNRVELMTIERDSGNVGIGTTSPSQELDVEGAADLNGRLNMRNNNINNVNQVEIDGAEGNEYQVRGGANTSYGISVRAAGGNPPNDHTIFAVESGGGATRFGVTQNNGGFFRDQLWVNAGGSTDNGEIFEGEINSASPSEIALRLDGGIGFNSSGTFGDSRIEATGGDISITSSSGSAINVGSTLSINGDNGIEFDFNFEQIQFRDIGGVSAIVFKDVFSNFPSDSDIESVLNDNEAAIFAYDAGFNNINLGWAETDSNGNAQTRSTF